MISFNPNDPLAPHATAPEANGRIAGISGIAVSGAVKGEVDFQYELCFKCHGDNFNGNRPNTSNKRLDFATAATTPGTTR